MTDLSASVAVALFNGSPYLLAQLNSLAAQTRPPCEIVIADDGSSDDSLRLVQQWANDSLIPVTVLECAGRLGYAQNFSRAIAACKGDVVFLCDQDDWWFPHKIDVVMQTLEADPDAMLVLNDAEFADSSLRPLGVTKIEQFRRAGLSLDAYVMGCCMALRRSFCDFALPMPDEALAHDCWLSDLARITGTRRIHCEVLQYYRRHGANASVALFNRVTPISRLDVLVNVVRHLYGGESFDLRHRAAHDQVVFARASMPLPDRLEQAQERVNIQLDSLRKQLELSERRLMLRRLPLCRRFITGAAMHFHLRASGGGLGPFVKDLFGNP